LQLHQSVQIYSYMHPLSYKEWLVMQGALYQARQPWSSAPNNRCGLYIVNG
jgi:hypothetical protein